MTVKCTLPFWIFLRLLIECHSVLLKTLCGSDLVLQTLDGLNVQARKIVFVVFLRRIRLPDVLSGNSPFIFSSKRKSAVSTDRCFLQDVSHPFGFPRVQFARLIYNGLLAFFFLIRFTLCIKQKHINIDNKAGKFKQLRYIRFLVISRKNIEWRRAYYSQD